MLMVMGVPGSGASVALSVSLRPRSVPVRKGPGEGSVKSSVKDSLQAFPETALRRIPYVRLGLKCPAP